MIALWTVQLNTNDVIYMIYKPIKNCKRKKNWICLGGERKESSLTLGIYEVSFLTYHMTDVHLMNERERRPSQFTWESSIKATVVLW